ncbi:ATPase family AAA domain-containing protein 2 isoform X3 [Aethina tumida]|uniref:ATPase family AAA domain-containing protein 2 isoform X3 n=1 Tax=Aethina tumida TaxID=116153 RepID=UPI0021492D91|nr:ATPase family AAA domain-containing protein 2 isoform X3 [Aethina tumida]
MSISQENTKPMTRASKKDKDFSKIGGLSNHVKTLRDIIILPLLYGNVFKSFNIRAPRGVLFYGPPGTGKTLVAGALATELNKEGLGKISFFHRKGADVLAKWIGESEKNLRDLFEKASKQRPSIIFFDEIDGLAPVRSQTNEHIHTSIVTTLLALMDGLDNTPGVIVIGATNRIENIDQALRRAGRFDRELYFPLPTLEGRKEIIQVHTSTWERKFSKEFINTLAEATAGFCGSDIAALCSEAVLCCMRRLYPNIECTGRKICIEVGTLKVDECDFMDARQKILPTGLRMGNHTECLNVVIRPLLQRQLDNILNNIQLMWPHFLDENYKYKIDDDGRYAGRLLLKGSKDDGLSYIISALIQTFEHLPAQILDITTISEQNFGRYSNTPSMLVLQRVDEWMSLEKSSEFISLLSYLDDLHVSLPILAIATCKKDLPEIFQSFFHNNCSIIIEIGYPTVEEKKKFFSPLFFDSNMNSLCTVLDQKQLAIIENSNESKPKSHVPNMLKHAKINLQVFNENGKRRCETENEGVICKRIKRCEEILEDTNSTLDFKHIKISRNQKYKTQKERFTLLLTNLLYERSQYPDLLEPVNTTKENLIENEKTNEDDTHGTYEKDI